LNESGEKDRNDGNTRLKQLMDDIEKKGVLEVQRESNRSQSLESLFWKRLGSHRKTDYGTNELWRMNS
jgi:hypothetical protein